MNRVGYDSIFKHDSIFDYDTHTSADPYYRLTSFSFLVRILAGAHSHFRAKREQLERVPGLLPARQGHILVSIVLHVPSSLDSGHWFAFSLVWITAWLSYGWGVSYEEANKASFFRYWYTEAHSPASRWMSRPATSTRPRPPAPKNGLTRIYRATRSTHIVLLSYEYICKCR